jgi:rod shape determining protein RodA
MTEYSRLGSSSYAASPRAVTGGRPPARLAPLRRLDWVLAGAVAALIALGSLLVWSATRERMLAAGLGPQTYLRRHLLNAGIGLVLGAVTGRVDYRLLRAYAPVVYVASVLGLVVVLSPLGSTINGAHSWINLGGGFEVQPAEFAKVALVVGMATVFDHKRVDRAGAGPRDSDVARVLALAAVPTALILLQPDLGTIMVLAFVVFGVLAVAGAPTRWLVGLLVAAAIGGGVVGHLHVLKDYQVKRFTSFANPAADPSGAGYNTQQARIAIGSGGVLGKGLFHGTQTKGRFIPEQQTDFIFTVAGEELGLVGGATVVGLLGVVLWRGLRIAGRAGDAFGTIVAAGVVSWIAFQSFVNIGMTLGITPVTGLPLPFVSYGGSAMFANLIAIGLLENVHLRSHER